MKNIKRVCLEALVVIPALAFSSFAFAGSQGGACDATMKTASVSMIDRVRSAFISPDKLSRSEGEIYDAAQSDSFIPKRPGEDNSGPVVQALKKLVNTRSQRALLLSTLNPQTQSAQIRELQQEQLINESYVFLLLSFPEAQFADIVQKLKASREFTTIKRVSPVALSVYARNMYSFTQQLASSYNFMGQPAHLPEASEAWGKSRFAIQSAVEGYEALPSRQADGPTLRKLLELEISILNYRGFGPPSNQEIWQILAKIDRLEASAKSATPVGTQAASDFGSTRVGLLLDLGYGVQSPAIIALTTPVWRAWLAKSHRADDYTPDKARGY